MGSVGVRPVNADLFHCNNTIQGKSVKEMWLRDFMQKMFQPYSMPNSVVLSFTKIESRSDSIKSKIRGFSFHRLEKIMPTVFRDDLER